MFYGEWKSYNSAMARANRDFIRDVAIAVRSAKMDNKDWKKFIDS